jgi:hypothetical protein
MFVIGLLALGQCNVNDNANTIERRACAFGSYEVFKAHVEIAVEKLGCSSAGTTCSNCNLATLDDCALFGILAAYSEEAGDSGLSSIQSALSQCIDPLLQGASSATIASAIGTSPQMPCEKQGKVDNEITTAAVVVGALSTALFAWSIINPVHNGEYGRLGSKP